MAYTTLLTPNGAKAVTPTDTINASTLLDGVALYVGVTGDVTLRPYNQEGAASPIDVLFKAVPAGTVLHLKFSRVKSTGTTATNMVALTGA